mmetsp:Transcript_13669/g.57466  ORF Transcript_13669/g.57466 Transcript_13669/m.57466 type:complete len:1028 (+) Transcript_13669:429-3512(+)
MAPGTPRPPVRRPLIAGVLFGLFLATLRGHWDSLRRTHDANPFHASTGKHKLEPTERDAHGWDARVSGEDAKTSADFFKRRAEGQTTHDVRVEVSSTRGNFKQDEDAFVLHDPLGRKDDGSFPTEQVSWFEPLTLRYPDPFETFRGCEPTKARDGLSARPLDLVADPSDAEWPVNCAGHEALCDVLRRVAIDREVLAAVANSAAPGIFEFVDGIKKLGVKNFVVVALDDALHEELGKRAVASYRVKNDAVGSHKVSAQKFSIVKEFVERGCSVLLTDTDVAYLRNPFPFLFRDADVESMSDGWDASSAFGFLETVDDASLGRAPDSGRRRAKTFRVAALNSGMWLVMATRASARLMTTMAHRMATEPDLWDQAGYNLELWFASRDDVRVSGATVRVLNPLCFVNSKVMFRFIRHAPALLKDKHVPVAMHSNYHTDKAFKMKRVAEYYTNPEATVDVLSKGCLVGCDADLKSVTQLERDAKANVNDAIVGSKKWADGSEGVWGGKGATARAGGTAHPSHCEPRAPAASSGRVAAYTPHAVPGKRGDFCASQTLRFATDHQKKGNQRDDDTTSARIALKACAAFAKLDKNAETAFLVAADGGDARAVRALDDLLEHGIVKFGLKSRTMVVTNSDRVASDVRKLGVQATVLFEGSRGDDSSSVVFLKWSVATLALADGRPVFLLDPATVLFADPIPFLHGDADVEAGSDGWDDTTAYGYDHVVDDPAMDWSRFCHGGRVVTNDPGFVKLAATKEAFALARLVARRVAAFVVNGHTTSVANVHTQNAVAMTDLEFEHLAFNEALFLPSHGDYAQPGVVKRVLNYLCFANSKTVFRFARKDRRFKDPNEHTPISVRLSYHPNEAVERADALRRYYAEGETGALLSWRDGEGGGDAAAGGGASCADAASLRDSPPAAPKEEDAHALGRHFRLHRSWSWGGVTPFSFGAAGALSTPWGEGAWGFIPVPKNTPSSDVDAVAVDGRSVFANSVFARFVGAVHVLTFEPDDEGEPYAMFVSERCQDGDMVVGRAVKS